MMEIFKVPNQINQYFLDQLILSSTLLGALVATSVFLLQSGFASFEFSRTMFLKYFVKLTRFMFLLLAYNIILSTIFLYLNSKETIAFFTHCVFSIYFSKYLLDFYSHKGYIYTLFSNKSNTEKGKFSQYVKYIFNLGLLQILIILILLFILIVYPLLLGRFGYFSEEQGFITTIIAFIFTVVSLIKILPQYFEFSVQEYKQKQNTELSNQIEVDLTKELEILKDSITKGGRLEILNKVQLSNIDGEIKVELVDKKSEAFFVINLWLNSNDVEQIVRWIEKYSYDFFHDLINTNVDINSFVLSYFINLDGIDKSKTYFIRATRMELEELFRSKAKIPEFINSVKNKLVDELFRNV